MSPSIRDIVSLHDELDLFSHVAIDPFFQAWRAKPSGWKD